jgi:uncharacterized protein with HEPN domain
MIVEDKKVLSALQDIYDASSKIIKYTEGLISKEFFDNALVRDAVERNLMIIGEATVRLRQLGYETLIPDADEIIGFRNHLVHGYDKLDYGMLWHAIKVDVPILIEIVEPILQENPSNSQALL